MTTSQVTENTCNQLRKLAETPAMMATGLAWVGLESLLRVIDGKAGSRQLIKTTGDILAAASMAQKVDTINNRQAITNAIRSHADVVRELVGVYIKTTDPNVPAELRINLKIWSDQLQGVNQ